MTYKFLRAVHIHPVGMKAGKDFNVGDHEVSEEFEYDPHFIRLVSLELITEVDMAKVAIAHPTPAQRAEKLLARLMAKRNPTPVAPSSPPKAEEDEGDEESETSHQEKPKDTDKPKPKPVKPR